MQRGPRRTGALAITTFLLALSSAGSANAQLVDLGETTQSLGRGELNVLPKAQEPLRDTVDRVVEPLRQVAPQPEPEPPAAMPPTTSPAPEVPGQGVEETTPESSQSDASSGGSDPDPSSAQATAPASGAGDGRSPTGDRSGGRDGGGRQASAGGAAPGNPTGRVDGGRRGAEVTRSSGPQLRDAIVNVIRALPSWVKAALLGLTVLLLAAVSYLVLTWRRLLAAERRASSDRLTGLANRTSAEDSLGRMLALAGRHERPLSVALFDLDHFKQINDTHGHQAGDAVLRAVGEASGGHVRGSDLVARFGGEEFLLLLPDTDLDGARAVAEKLRERIAALIVPAVPGGVSASFGLACSDGVRGEPSGSELISRADRALYAAKGAGRNRVVADGDSPRSAAREAVGAA